MVAVVNGSALGLFASNGSTGSPGLGQARERVFVNSTTGNLVIQGLDEILAVTGNDLSIARTYNSQGQLDGDNNDGWRIGVLRSISLVGSTTAPDRIIKTFGDGAQITYTLSGGSYVSSEGDGAHDSFQLVSGQWVWTDGSSRDTEIYNLSGQIVESRDADGNKFSYGYTNSLITTITIVSPAADASAPDQGGDGSTTIVNLEYTNPTTTKQLQRIRVTRNGEFQTLTSYTYDGQGRLWTVTVDLSPENTGDNNTYVTTYLYENTSYRVSSITQQAGGSSNVTASMGFSYELLNNEYRLKTYTDGENHTTTFNYSNFTAAGGTQNTANANGAVLSTTETQNVTNGFTLNAGAVSTTDTQTTTVTPAVISSQITTGASQVDTYNRNNGALSTTDTQTTTTNYGVIASQITSNATQTDNYNRNNAVLSTTDTQTTTTNYGVIASQITTNATQTDSYNRNNGVLSTTDTTTTTNNYNLNTGALTTPTGGGWGTANALEAEPAGSTASVPQMAFDSSGNGFAIWVVTTASTVSYTLKAARYTRATNTWAAPTSLYTSSTNLPEASMAVDAGGNAIVAWLAGGQISVARYTSSWGAASVVVSSGATLKPTVAIKGTYAAMIWGEGTAAGRNAFASRWNGTSWSTKAAVDSQTNPVAELAVAVDNLGNVIVAFSQREGSFTETCVWTNQLRAGTSTWTGAVSRDTLSSSAISPQIVLDGNGNGFLSFAQGGETAVIRYTRSSNSWEWSPTFVDNLPGNVSQTSLAIDATGNAVLGWVQAESGGFNSAFAAVYSASGETWGPAKLLESLNTTVSTGSLKTAISGDFASTVWVQTDGTNSNAYASTFNGLYWSAANVVESSANVASAPTLAVDALGNASTLWIQSNGTSPSVFMNRFVSGGSSAPPGGGWGPETALGEGSWYAVNSTKIAYANNGDAVAAWIQGPTVFTRRYIAATNLWQAAVGHSAPVAGVMDAVAMRLAVDPVTGSAAIAWVQAAVDEPDTMFMSYMNASGNWGAATSIQPSNAQVSLYEEDFGVSVAGTYAAVAFGQVAGDESDIYLTRMSNGVVSVPALVESLAAGAGQAQVAVDSAGNATVVWRQWVDGPHSFSNRWNATTQSFSGAVQLDSNEYGSVSPQIAFDAQGNGIAIYRQIGGLFARHFVKSTGAWGPEIALQSLPNDAEGFQLAMDSAGNAIVGWMQADAANIMSTYVNRFTMSTGTWGGSTLIESSAEQADGEEHVAVAINGDKAVVAWQQANGAFWDLYSARLSGGVWTTPAVMENLDTWSTWWQVGIDAAGRVGLTWIQQTDDVGSVPWFKRFDISSASSYTIPAGATWQSVANTLYGINSAAAGTALQTAMGNPALTTGAQLTGWPSTLTVSSTTTVTVPAYYNVPSGATWQSIANAVYGINTAAAGTALQSAMGNPALSTGLHLTGFPATLSITTTLAAHYLVPSGATWQSIVNALYGVNSAAAGTALQTALGNPSIAAGQRLYNIPATLSVTSTTTVTVAAYYLVPAGATWQSIANAVYGVNSAAAGAALQTAMGSLTLSTGLHLTGLPATLSIVTTVAPHYLVPAGATWQSIASALYGVNSAAAGSALQTALGNPSIASGTRLFNIPASLSVTTTATVTVPAYYLVPAGATWQSVANAVYGINSAAAGSALQTALGNPALTSGAHLANMPATLSVSTPLAAHYLVPAGATWQSVANTLYGLNSAAAGAALQTALGNPALTTGARLYNIPATLSVTTTTTITVPAYFVIPSSPSWQSIANTLYGVNSVAAGSALQAALGNPALTPGNRLTNLPAQLSVTTTQSVTVAPYYVVPGGATWATITQAIYNTSHSAAIAALQAAVGNPTLVANMHLTVPASINFVVSSNTQIPALPGVLQDHEDRPFGQSHDLNTASLSTTVPRTVYDGYNIVPGALSNTITVGHSLDPSLNTGALQTTEFRPGTFNLIPQALVTPAAGLQTTTSIPGTSAVGFAVISRFDASGNGMAVWRVATTPSTLVYSRYIAALDTWTSATQLSSGAVRVDEFNFEMDAAGNAIVAYMQVAAANTPGTIVSRVYSAATNTWGTASNIGTTRFHADVNVAIRGGTAAVSYAATNTTDNDELKMYVARYNSGTWTTGVNGELIGNSWDGNPDASGVLESAIGIDSAGVIQVVWMEGTATSSSIVARRFTGGSWTSPPATILTRAGYPGTVRGSFNSNGDGFIIVHGTVAKYVKATNTWSIDPTISMPTSGDRWIAIDDSGKAVAGWTGGATATTPTVIYYNGSTWSAPVQSFGATASSTGMRVAINNGKAIATWNESDGTVAYTVNESGSWTTKASINSSSGRMFAAVNSNSDMHLVWVPTTGGVRDTRYSTAGSVRSYFTVTNTSWQNIAASVYGVNMPEAGVELAARMNTGGLPLTIGMRLSGFPPSITFSATFSAAPYYDIPAGQTMQQVANTLYGVDSPYAGAALQNLIDTTAGMRTGNRLRLLPASMHIAWTTEDPTAPYFRVTNSDWQAIAATLYGTSSPLFATTLQAAMGGVAAPAVNTTILASTLPAPLQIPRTVYDTVPAYYRVPANATWLSVAQALYGQTIPVEAGAALQQYMAGLTPPITTLSQDQQLRGMPAQLIYNIYQSVLTTPYYQVPHRVPPMTWDDITFAVYGTNDPGAVIAAQGSLPAGTSILEGEKLRLPAQLTYTPTLGGAQVYRTTDVIDPLGLTTTYTGTVLGRLVSVLEPTSGGGRVETRYDYDVAGNVISIVRDPTGLNRVTTMTYTTAGNLDTVFDRAGNTVRRTYSATNQLLTESSYVASFPDATGSGQPVLTTRYVYDAESHLRFVISPEGRVTEHRYFNSGSRRATLVYTGATYTLTPFAENDLASWANNRIPVERTDYGYDFRGNLSKISRFDTTDATQVGTGTPSITRFTYDQRGNLINTIDARGETTTGDPNDFKTVYAYDGLGRQTSKTEWLDSGHSRTTLTLWNDASRYFAVTLNQTGQLTGLVSTTNYDRSGAVVSVANASTGGGALGTTSFLYDADSRLRVTTDASGFKTFFIYDEMSRKVGEVDGKGRLTQYLYNSANQIAKVTRYSSFLPATTLTNLNSQQGAVALSALLTDLATVPGRDANADQVAVNSYDLAGQLEYEVDAARGVRKYIYDGASRVTNVIQYATPLAAGLTPQQVSVSPTADRRVRNLYTNDGLLQATVNSQGYVVEYEYDQAGHLIHQIEYANPSDSTNLWTDSLTNLRPAADTEITFDSERDQHTYFLFNGQGQQVATLDAEGYLTESKYNETGLLKQSIRYQGTTAFNTSLATMIATATGVNQSTGFVYDGAGRLTSQTNFENTPTTLEYNALNEVTSTLIGDRQTQTRYDELGRVKQELGGEGSAAIPGGANQATIDSTWTQWGRTYAVDSMGRRTSSTDQYGNKSFFFYDSDGRLRYTVTDMGDGSGEATESVYNALGQVTDTIAYTARISMTGITAGGAITTTLTNAIAAATSAANDSHGIFTYKPGGQVATQSNAEGGLATFAYNGFGELDTKTIKINTLQNRVSVYNYDQRGLLSKVTEDGSGINHIENYTYDAFGRRTSVKDQYNNLSKVEYDRIGRATASVSAMNERRVTGYDSFSRVRTVQDAVTGTTTYTYVDSTRTMTISTLEGVSVSMVHNIFGETVTITDGVGNVKSFGYNKDGQVKTRSDSVGTIETLGYDRAGRLDTSTDGRNAVTKFGYDAASRTLTRTDDYGGLPLQTTYVYDGQGRVSRVTEPGNRVSETTYYRDGRIKQTTTDPSGANIRCLYEYDAAGDTVKVTEHLGSSAPQVTQYKFDNLNRRIEESVDPTGLNLTTQYKYDANGNLTRKTEAIQRPAVEQRSTWYTYDADSRLVQTVDALGNVTQLSYDGESRVTATKQFATPVSVASFGDSVALLTPTPNASLDRIERTAYDRDGRAVYTIDSLGGITERSFDGEGRVTRTRMYGTRVTIAGNPTAAQVVSALSAVSLSPSTIGITDQVTWTAYDLRGRAEFTVQSIDGAMARVQRVTYDLADNVVMTRAFVATRTIAGATDVGTLRDWATTNANNTATGDQVTAFWYDNVGRQRFKLDAEGYLTETRFADANNVVTKIGYAVRATALSVTSPYVDVNSFATTAANGVGAHVSIVWRDAAGRVRFVLDGERYLTETRYDDSGLQVTDFAYGLQLSPTRLTSTSLLADAAAVAAASDVVNSLGTGNKVARYDAAGRLSRTTYSLDGTYEEFTYDGLGNKKTYQNQAGSIWTYIYDRVGNMLEERSPTVSVTVISTAGDENILIPIPPANVSIVTRMTYNAFGNVQTRTEGIRRFADNSESVTGSRQTTYGYDALGHQTTVTFPQVSVYAPPANDELNTDATTMRRETLVTPTTTTTYDTFGNAVMNVDVNGAYSRKSYDNLGRVKCEVDPLKDASDKPYVTEYVYDAFGNKTVTLRYASPMGTSGLSPTAVWSAAEIQQRIVSGASDRGVATTFDRRNQQVRVVQSASDVFVTAPNTPSSGTVVFWAPEAKYQYNAFGQVSLYQALIDPTTLTYAETRYFYNGNGQESAKIDAQGFVTKQEYDVRGNVTRVCEYAKALTGAPSTWNPANAVDTTYLTAPNAASGYDRDLRMTYDTLGRMTSKSLLNVEVASVTGSTVTTSFQTQTTTFGYDAVGNRTRETTSAGSTYSYYDVLGRIIAIADPTRDVDGTSAVANITPLIELKRDVYGNIVSETRYGDGAVSATATGYTAPSGGLQQSSLLQYDVTGRVMRTVDSVGANRFVSYDVRGNVVKEWQPVTNADGVVQTLVKIHEYDVMGRETAVITPLRRSDALPITTYGVVADTMRLSGNYVPPEWVGENLVQVVWPQVLPTNVRVELSYYQYSRTQGDGPLATKSLSFSQVTNEAFMRWTDSSTAANGGVLRVDRVRVWAIGAGGAETLIADSAAAAPILPSSILTTSYTQNIYNAFGEIARQGINIARQSITTGTFQILNEYDAAGHLWRTNDGGDGVRKIYLYDAAGRRTGEIRSQQIDLLTRTAGTALALSSTLAMRTETVYNGIGQVVEQRLPLFTSASGAAAAPTQKRKLDRWGNIIEATDTAGQITNYRYTVLGELAETKQPLTTILNTSVSLTATTGNPTQNNYYDLLGHLIAMRDGNGNVNSNEVNAAGKLLVERHADGGLKTFNYDGFGNQTRIVNELGSWTKQLFDAGNRLIEVQTQYAKTIEGGVVTARFYLVRNFGYDDAGRRTFETSGEYKTDGTPEKIFYFYDSNGNVASRRSAMGYTTWFEYDIYGNMVSEKNQVGGLLTWQYDAFGHVQAHADLGRNVTNYTYDKAGLLDTQINTAVGQNLNYDYDAAGNLTTITDTGTGMGRVTTFGYDTAGRRSREKTVINSRTLQDLTIGYDQLGRMSTLSDVRYSLTYQYDGQSNRTHTNGSALDHNNVSQVTDLWYTYDAMNRVRLSQAARIGNTLSYTSLQGMDTHYDLAGMRQTVDQYGSEMLQRADNWNSSTQQHEISYRYRFGYYQESYVFDDAGRMLSLYRSGEAQNLVDGRESGSGTPLPLDGVLTRNYDGASRVVKEESWRVAPSTTLYQYDDDGHMILQTSRMLGAVNGPRDNETEYFYDGAGVLRRYNVASFGLNGSGGELLGYTSTYGNTYLLADTYLLTQQIAMSVQGPMAPVLSGLVTRTYNVNRELTSALDSKLDSNRRFFLNNAAGQAILTVGTAAVNAGNLDSVVGSVLTNGGFTYRPQHFFYANGQTVGTFGLATNGNPNDSTMRANFDVNFTNSMDQVSPTMTPEVVVRAGDTLRSIALRALGDGNLWYLIADENALSSPDSVLPVGMTLRLPNKVGSLSNTASVFKPFNAADTISDMTPFLKVLWKPPGPDKCAQTMMIILVAAMIVMSIMMPLTAPITGTIAATTAQSILSGVVSSAFEALFSQVIAGGIDIVNGGHGGGGFDFKAVLGAGLSGGILAGLNVPIRGLAATISKNVAVQAALVAVANNALSQGVNLLLKNQKEFDWRSVATSAVTGPLATKDKTGRVASFFSSVTQTMARGGRVDEAQLIGDVFGGFIGDAVAVSMMAHMGGAAEDKSRRAHEEQHQLLEGNYSERRMLFASNDLGGPSDLNSRLVGPGSADATSAEAEGALEEIVVTGYVKRVPGAGGAGFGGLLRGAFTSGINTGEQVRGRHRRKPTDDEVKLSLADRIPTLMPLLFLDRFAEHSLTAAEKRLHEYGDVIKSLPDSLQKGADFVMTEIARGAFYGIENMETVQGAKRLGAAADEFNAHLHDGYYSRQFGNWWESTNFLEKAGQSGDVAGALTVDVLAFESGGALLRGAEGLSIFARTSFAEDIGYVGSEIGSIPGFEAPSIFRTSANSMRVGEIGYTDQAGWVSGLSDDVLVNSAIDDFVGPTIGKSGYRSPAEFSEAAFVQYQRFVDAAYDVALRAESEGLLTGMRSTRVGTATDEGSSARFAAWLESEGIPEGPNGLVRMEARLMDPRGSGKLVKPDIRIPSANSIFDATVGWKWGDNTQLSRFSTYSGGNRITIVRPSQLSFGEYAGSYSVIR